MRLIPRPTFWAMAQRSLFLLGLAWVAGTAAIWWNLLAGSTLDLLREQAGLLPEASRLLSNSALPGIGEELAKLMVFRVALERASRFAWARNRWGYVDTFLIAFIFMSAEAWLYGSNAIFGTFAQTYFQWLTRTLLVLHLSFWAVMAWCRFRWWSWVPAAVTHAAWNFSLMGYDAAWTLLAQAVAAASVGVWLILILRWCRSRTVGKRDAP